MRRWLLRCSLVVLGRMGRALGSDAGREGWMEGGSGASCLEVGRWSYSYVASRPGTGVWECACLFEVRGLSYEVLVF